MQPYPPLSSRNSRIHILKNLITVAGAGALVLATSGCLPIILGTPATLKPGDMTLSLAGMGRSSAMPYQVKQGGTASGIIELRGGMMESLDSAVTFHIPWSASWDLKYQVIPEQKWIPGMAVQAVLGAVQPSFTGTLLMGKTFGPVTATASGSVGRTNERLWRPGGTPYGTESESMAKEIYAWGGAIEYEASRENRFFINAIAWNNVREEEVPKFGKKIYGINEGVSWFFAAGIRVFWQMPKISSASGSTMTVLRGYILAEPAKDSLVIGQEGLFQATVLTDSFTRYLRDGKPADKSELRFGMPVLVQGLPMPKPSTFLARTIELQGEK